jgi:Amidohydrolase
MRVDSHMHPFPDVGSASGYATPADHLRGVQRQSYFNVNPTRRLRDDAIVERQTLWNERDPGAEGLLDVGLRSGRYGRLEWTYEGEELYVQLFAPSLQNNESSAAYVVAEMDYAEVDVAICQTGPTYGRLNEFLADSARRYPSRLLGLAQIREPEAHTDEQLAELHRCVSELGFRGLFYSFLGFWEEGHVRGPDDPAYAPFWDSVAAADLVVYWDVNVDVFPTPDAYERQLQQIRTVLDRHDLKSVLVQALPLDLFFPKGQLTLPEVALDLGGRDSFHLEVAYPISYGRRFEYPYAELFGQLEQLYDTFGPQSLLWGSDMPNVLRFCTYRQSYEYLNHATFLSDADRALITGGNLARTFRLTPEPRVAQPEVAHG